MTYIGSTPTTQSFISGTDYFNGDGATVAFTLSRTVVSPNDIEAVVNNVVQQPNSAYTISGTTITFTSAPSSGTSNIYVRYMSTTTQSITPSQNTVSYSTWNSDLQNKTWGFKNRIINGAMVIDQRNAGASVTPTSDSTYTLDRWVSRLSVASKYSVQQNAGSVTPPTGFSNYLGVTSLSAYTVGASEYFQQQHRIEGFNVADLNWGTANAKTITISFWVRSSLTGSFGASLTNNDASRWYPFSYTISSANTWTQISVTIAGDTTGTWTTTNTTGLQINFGLGVGSTYSGGGNAWTSSVYIVPASSVSVVGTNGATWYITGVQLEVGTQATNFDVRSYGTELQLCQRYYFQITPNGTQYSAYSFGYGATATDVNVLFRYPVPPRTACTGITAAGTASWIVQQSTNLFNPTLSFIRANQTLITVNAALSGVTAGQGANLIDGNNASYIYFNGMEL